VKRLGYLLYGVLPYPETGQNRTFDSRRTIVHGLVQRIRSWLLRRGSRRAETLRPEIARSIDEAFDSFSREFRTY
jgi:hypothetical protein